MREREGEVAAWIGEWDAGERKERGLMDERVGCWREVGARLDGWGSGMREREGGGAGWMGVWDEGERRGQGWMDAEVG